MNVELKKEISARRMNGEGYKLIASELGLNLNSVRSYCRRNGLGGYAVDVAAKFGSSVTLHSKKLQSNSCMKHCMQCGKL